MLARGLPVLDDRAGTAAQGSRVAGLSPCATRYTRTPADHDHPRNGATMGVEHEAPVHLFHDQPLTFE
jgi:hypothetical protein